MTWNPARTYAVLTSVLFLKMVITLLIQQRMSVAAGTAPDQENDRGTSYTAATEDVEGGGKHDLAKTNDRRWRRIVQNDLENIPIALLVFLGSANVDAHNSLNQIFMWVFLGARLCHTVIYAMNMQPFRTIAWLVGIVCVAGSAILGLVEIIF